MISLIIYELGAIELQYTLVIFVYDFICTSMFTTCDFFLNVIKSFCSTNQQEEFKEIKKRQIAKEITTDKKAPGASKRGKKRKRSVIIDSDEEGGPE